MKKLFLHFIFILSIASSIHAEFSPNDLAELENLTMGILETLSPEEQELILKDAIELDKKIREMSPEEQKAIQDELEKGLKEMMDTGAIDNLKYELEQAKLQEQQPLPSAVEEIKKIEEKEDQNLKAIIKEIAEKIDLAITHADKHIDADVVINEWMPVRPIAEELRSNLLTIANDAKIMTKVSSDEFSILKAQLEGLHEDLKKHADKLLSEAIDKVALKAVISVLERKASELKIGIKKLFEKFSKEEIENAKKNVPAIPTFEQLKNQNLQEEKKLARGTTVQKTVKANTLTGAKTGAAGSKSTSPGYAGKAPSFYDDYDYEDYEPAKPSAGKSGGSSAGASAAKGGKVDGAAKADKAPTADKAGAAKGGKASGGDKGGEKTKARTVDFTEPLENQKTVFQKKLSKLSKAIKETKLNEIVTGLIKDIESKPQEINTALVNTVAKSVADLKNIYSEIILEADKAGKILKNLDNKKKKEEGAKIAKMVKDKKPVSILRLNLQKIAGLDVDNNSVKNLQAIATDLIAQNKDIKKKLGLKENE